MSRAVHLWFVSWLLLASACSDASSDPAGGGAPAASGCASLQSCCEAIEEASIKQACETTVTSYQSTQNAQQLCDAAFATYEQSGLCSGGGTAGGSTGGAGGGAAGAGRTAAGGTGGSGDPGTGGTATGGSAADPGTGGTATGGSAGDPGTGGEAGSPTGMCGELAPPEMTACCDACQYPPCQDNGCFNGWWCDTSSCFCRPAPDPATCGDS